MRSFNRMIAVITMIVCVVMSISACKGDDPSGTGVVVQVDHNDETTEESTWSKAREEENASRNNEKEKLRAQLIEIDDQISDIMLHMKSKATDVRKHNGAFEQFALNLFRECRNNRDAEGSILISPLSVCFALAMAANGAREETLVQMEDVLGLSVSDLNEFVSAWNDLIESDSKLQELRDIQYSAVSAGKKRLASTSIETANSAWLKNDQGLRVNNDFLDVIQNVYDGELFKAAFDDSTVKEINSWIEENTDGMIKNMIDTISDTAKFFLINTLLFEGKWNETFSKEDVTDDIFTTYAGEEKEMTFMNGSADKYLEDGRAVGIKKHYSSLQYSFAAIMPKEGIGIDEYLSGIDAKELENILYPVVDRNAIIDLSMPKYSSEYYVKMKNVLRNMGMTDVFDSESADLSALGTYYDINLYVDDVLHKTYIEVDEEGTRAGAASAVIGLCGGIPQERIEVKLNRPFIYMIIDESSRIPLFIGTFEG